MSAADREQYDAYVDARLIAFQDYAGFGAFVWRETYSLARGYSDRGWGKSDADAFKGAWHTVRPHVTEEFRVWVDEMGADRRTYSDWLADAIHDRKREASRAREYVESSEFCTDQLEQWRELNARRDEIVCDARARGASFAEIQAATGLSRAAVHNIVVRERDRLAAAAADAARPAAVADAAHVEILAGVEYAF